MVTLADIVQTYLNMIAAIGAPEGPLDKFETLTESEIVRMRQLKQGVRYTASARVALEDFAIERGWSPADLADVLRRLGNP